jgi:molybdopterin-synthase adenylyltransferase
MILSSRLDSTAYTHEKMKNFSVAIVGVGAIGTEIARLLGTLEVGRVILIDDDRVEPINRTKSIFFRRPGDMGHHKTDIVATQAREYFPNINWVSIPQEIADVGFQDLVDCSLIFSATDNTLARVETAYLCRRLKIPMIDTGLLGSAYWCARTAWFAPTTEAACYLCLLSETKRAEILTLAHSIRQSCTTIKENIDTPSTPTMASVIAGMAIDLAFQICLPADQNTSMAWDINLDNCPTLTSIALRKSANCPFHTFPDKHSLIELNYDSSFQLSLQNLGLAAIELDWPIVSEMRCEQCGKRLYPMKRLAWIRRHGRCSSCGSPRLSPLKAIHRIVKGEQFSEYSPRDFSFSCKHLYTAISKSE